MRTMRSLYMYITSLKFVAYIRFKRFGDLLYIQYIAVLLLI